MTVPYVSDVRQLTDAAAPDFSVPGASASSMSAASNLLHSDAIIMVVSPMGDHYNAGNGTPPLSLQAQAQPRPKHSIRQAQEQEQALDTHGYNEQGCTKKYKRTVP